MRRLMAFWGMVVALAAASPVLADDGVQLGATYRGMVQFKTYGSPQLPLPPGDWKLVGLTESRSDTTNIRVLQGALLQVRTGVMAGRVIFTVPDSPSRGGWARPANCERKNILANFSASATMSGGYDCLTLEAVTMIRSANADKLGAQFYDYLDANKIKKPGTALSVGFNVSDGRTFVAAAYLFNPDMEKVPPAVVTSWHLDRYKDEPKRAAYVEKMKSWAQEWRAKVINGAKGNLSSSSGMAAMTSPSAAKTVSSVASPQIGKVYRDVLQLDTYGTPQIALPPGDWKLVVIGEGQSDKERIRLVRGYLIQTKGKAIAGRVYFNVPDAPSSLGWARSDNCTRKEPLADLTRNAGSSKGYDCASITAYGTGLPKNAMPQLKQFHDYLEKNGIEKPPTMINIGYGLSNGAAYVTVEYQFNQSLDGVRADNLAAWRAERIGEDSRRRAYIEKMKAWAQEWHPKVEAGFKSALPR